MKISLGADHGGFGLKETIKAHLEEKGHEIIDCGAYGTDSCHYPAFAEKASMLVAAGECQMGILVCGTGIGMSIAANKIKGVRAAVAGDCFSARMTRMHNNANVLCIGERVTGPGLALMIVDSFVEAAFEGGRHQARVDMIADIEARQA